jgi:hypothetical protein
MKTTFSANTIIVNRYADVHDTVAENGYSRDFLGIDSVQRELK